MSDSTVDQASEADIEKLLKDSTPEIRALVHKARALLREIAPDPSLEIDWTAKMIGWTLIPGTYKGLILTLSPAKKHVSIVFSKGVELHEAGLDDEGLLEGKGKKARHIKVYDETVLDDPATRKLIEAAVERTPRA